jgi:hypothetical protein
MKLQLGYIDWPYGIDVIGVFTTQEKGREYFKTHYVGTEYAPKAKYSEGMLEFTEEELDPT